ISRVNDTEALYVGIVNASRDLAGVFRAENPNLSSSINWVAMGQPTTLETVNGTPNTPIGANPGHQGELHFSIVANPINVNVIYVGGDRQPGGGGTSEPTFPNASGLRDYVGRLFRGEFVSGGTGSWTPIVGDGAQATAPHADSRAMVFTASGTILEGDDG